MAEELPEIEVHSDVIETVRRQYDGLTQSQKRIAESIVDDPEFVAFATVDKLASRLDVSPSTIVRFAYKVGLDGYQDLQARVRTLIRAQMRHASEPQDDTSATGHLADTSFAASLERDVDHLLRTIKALDRGTLARAVEVLASADRIFVTGDITSYSLAYYFALAANRARGKVHLVKADGEGAARLIEIGPEDALLAFTFPPYSKMVLRVVEWAIESGATSIGITDHAVSPVGRRVSIVLPAVTSGLGPQNTLVPGMAIANALLNALILENEERSVTRYKSVNRLLGKWELFVLGEDESE
ncbi:MAG: MurR/RpiR family transcriptional regulator [Acidimicrobiia bacterium]